MKTQLFNIKKLPKLLFKYRDFNKESHLKLLLEGQLYMSSPRKFNDIYDCKIPIRFDFADEEYLKKEIRNVIQKVNDAPVEVKNHVADIFVKSNILNHLRGYSTNDSFLSLLYSSSGVYSLSSKYDNLLMWGHYANNHSGFCIGLNTDYYNTPQNSDHWLS